MVEDVRLAVEGKKPVYFDGTMSGYIPDPRDITKRIVEIKEGK